jgi:hypothetical protein
MRLVLAMLSLAFFFAGAASRATELLAANQAEFGNTEAAQGQSQPTNSTMDWPEATARFTEMRTRAETCVGLLKTYGKPNQIAHGKLVYSEAKAKIDGAISGLITALATNGRPDSLPNLQSMIDQGSAGLIAFCESTSKVVPRVPGERGLLADIVKEAIEPLVKAISSGVAALYNNHRKDAELTRRTIQTQLEAAKWPAFDVVQRAH